MNHKAKIAAAMRGLSLPDLMAVLNAANNELASRGFHVKDFDNRDKEIVHFSFVGGRAYVYLIPKFELLFSGKASEKENPGK